MHHFVSKIYDQNEHVAVQLLRDGIKATFINSAAYSIRYVKIFRIPFHLHTRVA